MESTDLKNRSCSAADERNKPEEGVEAWTDVSEQVCAALEAELDGKYVGTGWRRFMYAEGGEGPVGMRPDMVLRAR